MKNSEEEPEQTSFRKVIAILLIILFYSGIGLLWELISRWCKF